MTSLVVRRRGLPPLHPPTVPVDLADLTICQLAMRCFGLLDENPSPLSEKAKSQADHLLIQMASKIQRLPIAGEKKQYKDLFITLALWLGHKKPEDFALEGSASLPHFKQIRGSGKLPTDPLGKRPFTVAYELRPRNATTFDVLDVGRQIATPPCAAGEEGARAEADLLWTLWSEWKSTFRKTV